MTATPLIHRLQLLVKADRRRDVDLHQAAARARQLGIEVTGIGTASISGRLEHNAFTQLFGSDTPSSSTDSLPIPPGLDDFILSITEAPQHLTMDHDPTGGMKP